MAATKTKRSKKKPKAPKKMADRSQRDMEFARKAKEKSLEQAGDAVLAGNRPLADAKLVEANGVPPTDAERMARLRELRAKERELAVDLESAALEYKRLKKSHEATVGAIVRAVDEPLQPGLFDKVEDEPRATDEVDKAVGDTDDEPKDDES